jgi:DNA primase
VVRIPAGKDPDELIRTDPDAWRRAVAEAKPVIEYFIDRTAADVGLDTVAGKRELTGRVLALLKRVGDPIERNLYLQRLGQLVGVEERVLAEALQREPVRRPVSRPATQAETSALRPPLPPLETEALTLLLRYPGLVRELPEGERLPLRDAMAVALASAWRRHVAELNGTAMDAAALERFVAGLDPATAELARDLLARIAATDGEQQLDAELAPRVLRTTLLRLRIQRLDEDLRDGRLLLEEAQRDGDQARLEAIEKRLIQLGREKAEATREMHEPAEVAGVRRT